MADGIIILAGGKGTRYGSQKQFINFHGKQLWQHVYEKTVEITSNTVIVGVDVPSGETRSKSVMNGLHALREDTEHVLIAEAARPLVTKEQMKTLLDDEYSSKTFVMPLVNTVIGRDGTYYDRNKMYELLVPQAFDYKLLLQAYNTGKYTDMTDETRVMYEEYGIKPKFFETSQNLYKVTYPQDIAVLELLFQQMKEKQNE